MRSQNQIKSTFIAPVVMTLLLLVSTLGIIAVVNEDLIPENGILPLSSDTEVMGDVEARPVENATGLATIDAEAAAIDRWYAGVAAAEHAAAVEKWVAGVEAAEHAAWHAEQERLAAKVREESSARSHTTTSTAPARGPAPAPVATGSNRSIGQQMAAARGWVGEQWSCLDSLWTKESGWVHNVWNKQGSGAYGIPQALPGSKMASHGADWETNPRTQIAWGLDYIAGRYGTPCGAWSHSKANNWY